MKIKNNLGGNGSSEGGIAIPERYSLEYIQNDGIKKESGVAAAIAFSCSLIALALLSGIAWMMYQNWELIKDV